MKSAAPYHRPLMTEDEMVDGTQPAYTPIDEDAVLRATAIVRKYLADYDKGVY